MRQSNALLSQETQLQITPKVLHWSKRTHHPWDVCCDASAVVAIFLLLHEELESYYISFSQVHDFVSAFFCQPIVFDGALDLKQTFAGRSDKEVAEELVEILLALVQDEVLEPDKTEGLTAQFRLIVSVKRDLHARYLRLASEKRKQAQWSNV